MVNLLDPFEVNRQFVLHFRTNISNPNDPLNTKTESFTATASQTNFELTEDLEGGEHTVKNMEYVKVNSATKTFLSVYNYYIQGDDAGTVIFNSGLSNGDSVEIKYWLGPRSWIYSDFPRLDLRLSHFPRISVETVAGNSDIAGIGGEQFTTSITVAVTCFGRTIIECKNLGNEVREFVLNNAKTLIYQSGCENYNYVRLSGFSKILIDPNRIDKIFQQTWDYEVMNIDEEV